MTYQVDQLCGYPWIEDEIEIFSNCGRILDIGCGTGWFTQALIDAYPTIQVVCIDTENAIKFSKLEFIIASAIYLPFESSSFQAVSCKAVLEHLREPLQAIREIHRVLKEDGIVFISVPHPKSRTFWDDYTHVRPYNLKSMEAMLIDGGFELENSWTWGGFPGLGILMRAFNIKNQRILRVLGKSGINRDVLSVVARKN
jgi:SAM-dependent methyltransferase